MTVNEFKKKYKSRFTDDVWGTALDTWFEAVGWMYVRGLNIPEKYQYTPGFNAVDEESKWHDDFAWSGEITNWEVTKIAEYLYRYLRFLKFKKVDY